MSDPYVRETGRVEDMDGGGLVVGVDYDTVTVRGSGQIGHAARLSAAQAEEFAQLFVSAVWQAGQQAGRMEEVVDAEIPPQPEHFPDAPPYAEPFDPPAWKTDAFWDSEASDGS